MGTFNPKGLLFEPPNGIRIFGADIDVMLKLIRDASPAYWCIGEACAYICDARDPVEHPSAFLKLVPAYGFYLEVEIPKSGIFIPTSSENFADVARIWVQQNYMNLPRAFFVDAEVAAQIVECLFKNRAFWNDIQWTNRKETDWEFYDDGDDEVE